MPGLLDDDRTLRARRHGARVVLVEDDDAMRDLLEETLWRDGYDVRAASSGVEASRLIETMTLHAWSARAVDLVVSDVRLPGLGGLQLGDMVREARWSTPLIFITAFPDDRIRDRVMAAGAYGFLGKPFEGQALIDCIECALEA